MELLQQLKSSLVNQPKSFDDCITWARNQFQEYYYNTIVQLLFNFPADHVSYAKLNTTVSLTDVSLHHQVTSSGQPFWSGPKRCPKSIIFDPTEVSEEICVHTMHPTHIDIVVFTYGLHSISVNIVCQDIWHQTWVT